MKLQSKYARTYYSLLILIFLVACSSVPKLSSTSPTSINLTGTWVLNKSLSQDVIMKLKSRGGDNNNYGRPDQSSENGEREARRNQNLGKPPAMTVTEMKIDQGDDGMGIAYPEHPYRDVDWGTHDIRRATVTAGWREDTVVVYTNSQRQTYTEIYSLDLDGKTLSVSFDVNGLNGKEQFVRVFELQEE